VFQPVSTLTAASPVERIEQLRVARPRLDLLALAAILIVAAVARLSLLDLMEFKGDEAAACRLALHVLGYSEPGVGRFFPTQGLISSIGIPNPPLFVYVVAVPLAVVRSPIAAAATIALLNVIAIWITFVVGRRAFNSFVGVVAAALIASSPWSIVFSRKIWAQDLLPFCTALFALHLYRLVVQQRASSAFWLIVIAAAATQLHFSAWILFGVVAAALWTARRSVTRGWIVGGISLATLSYLPFLYFHGSTILRTARHHGSTHNGPSVIHRFEQSLRFMFDISGGGGMSFLIGRASPLAPFLSLVLGLLAIFGVTVTSLKGSPTDPRLGRLLLLWFALPLLALTALPVRPYIHYFIVLSPLPYLGIACALHRLTRARRILQLAAVAAILGCFAILDAHMLRTVVHDGGAPGDYGIAYRYKRDAVKFMLHRSRPANVTIGADLNFENARWLRTYRFLLWNEDIDRAWFKQGPRQRYVLVERFLGLPPRLRASRISTQLRHTNFGPLIVVQVP
jgi:hypothetical protein